MNLQRKIITLRKQSGLSQEDMAEKLHVSRQTISRWEVGLALPDAENLRQLSQLFKVTTDYLLNDAYESDGDIPRVKNAEETLEKTVKNNQKLFLFAAVAFIVSAACFMIAGIEQHNVLLMIVAAVEITLSGFHIYRYEKAMKP